MVFRRAFRFETESHEDANAAPAGGQLHHAGKLPFFGIQLAGGADLTSIAHGRLSHG